MKSDIYKKSIASILESDPYRIFLYWKGRVALYAILKAMELDKDSEVIIPALTCVVVPNAIIYAGLKPVYIDVEKATFNMNVSLIESAITEKTKVIVCQNTYGLSSNIEEILTIAKKYNLFTIEDCTHGFGGYYNGKPNGSYCDAAFYSTQWNKPFSTGIGGFLYISNNELFYKVKKLESEKIKPGIGEISLLRFLLIFRKFAVNKFTQPLLVVFYRFLSNKNLILGSNQGNELNSIEKPKSYFKDISTTQIKTGIKSLSQLKEMNELRLKNAKDYTDFLKSENKNHVEESYFKNHMFLKYPLLVKDRKLFNESAREMRITLGDWFISPLHPVEDDLSKWFFESTKFPIASQIAKTIINLPTDIRNNDRVIEFLKKNLESIY
ncbi:MAG: DegT/DnrJ/EryC1/StrS aminotransferase family protein [Ignavibacterium sp.]|nr:DegT/DnrJ/EryC1/StrS aminotransferase family protein [Ignavibacterium sp.]